MRGLQDARGDKSGPGGYGETAPAGEVATMKLELYSDYDREQVHDIFAPTTKFRRGAGSWGVAGIVPIPNRLGDFVFLVTFGRSQGDHTFDEGISADGVLRWQSQPRQTLDDPAIRSFISHDDQTNAIYLFLRTRLGVPYTYLGRLRYLLHERGQEQPVRFKWQLIDWPIPDSVLDRMGLALEGAAEIAAPLQVPDLAEEIDRLVETDPPTQLDHSGLGVSSPKFVGKLRAGRAESDSRNRELGFLGECSVVDAEKRRLSAHGKADLAEKVRHVAAVEGDGAGYDVLSFTLDGEELYIEVKTTCGPRTTDFYISAHEVVFSQTHPDRYEIRRIYDFDRLRGVGSFFRLRGDITQSYLLRPTAFRVSRLSAGEDRG